MSQIHIIPFDVGYVFFDVLNTDNSKNLKMAESFISELSGFYNDSPICISNNIKLTFSPFIDKKKTIANCNFINGDKADHAICVAKLSDCMECYLLANGIGVFVIADIGGKALIPYKSEIKGLHPALVASFQKRISQSSLLGRKKDDISLFPEEERLMLEFRNVCWTLIKKVASRFKIRPVRTYSSNSNYKFQVLSYVLKIYVLNQSEISEKEQNYLMYASVPKLTGKKDLFYEAQKRMEEYASLHEECCIKTGSDKLLFSWSGVCILLDDNCQSFEELTSNSIICSVIRTEIYIQSRWFIGDNSLDNAKKNYNMTLEDLQRVESLLEYYAAEIENEISANMSTMQKEIVKKVVETSAIKSLYDSVLRQVCMQRRIKSARDMDRKKKNTLIVNSFLAIFTASSLYKTVSEIIEKDFSTKNILIFIAMLVVAIGTILVNYYNSYE